MMKIRTNFITNSSSSSFCISKDELTDYTVEVFKNPKLVADQIVPTCDCTREEYMELAKEWDIRDEDGKIYGFVSVANFDYSQIFYICGVDWDLHKDSELAPSLLKEMVENGNKNLDMFGDDDNEDKK